MPSSDNIILKLNHHTKVSLAGDNLIIRMYPDNNGDLPIEDLHTIANNIQSVLFELAFKCEGQFVAGCSLIRVEYLNILRQENPCDDGEWVTLQTQFVNSNIKSFRINELLFEKYDSVLCSEDGSILYNVFKCTNNGFLYKNIPVEGFMNPDFIRVQENINRNYTVVS